MNANGKSVLSKSERPKIKPEKSGTHNLLDIVSIAALVIVMVKIFTEWSGLPEIVPVHFNMAGEPDGYGSRFILLSMPAISLFMYITLSIVARFPHTFNFAWPITMENAEKQYRLAVDMLVWLKMELTVLFCFITWIMIQSAMGGSSGLGIWFLPVFIGAILGTTAIYLVAAYRNK